MRHLLLALLLLIGCSARTQTVGLVLSGGGATGMAHIGVLKALEEKNIKIDYITGTSAGALIGSLYASGFSPDEIQKIAESEEFQLMVDGLIEESYAYYFKEPQMSASWMRLHFNKDSIFNKGLPTNFITPTLIDFQMLSMYSGPSASAQDNFDNLFVPFRCVASDINTKTSIVFDKGPLSRAVRASMSYPFYLKPIVVDGVVMFDGGLYNNFPIDVMMKDFNPDFIIGSNVSGNNAPATPDDLLSQVKNMIVSSSNFDVPEGKGIMIEPEVDQIGTFDFQKIKKAIAGGYQEAMALCDSIISIGIPTQDSSVRAQKRAKFKSQIPPLKFKTTRVNGLNKKQSIYANKLLNRKNKTLSLKEFKKNYFKLALDDNVAFTYPTAFYNAEDSSYDVEIEVTKQKEIVFELGGNFSSRPINTGYLGLEYGHFGKYGIKLIGNSYFGKYYGAAYGAIRFNFPTKIPINIEPFYSLNRWDYFRSFATFFEESRPSFIVNREQYGGLKVCLPAGNRSKLSFEGLYADMDFRYYQVEEFSSSDTADVTNFYPIAGKIHFERSTLNRKQYANYGTYLSFKFAGVQGTEVSYPGNTNVNRDSIVDHHTWVYAQLKYRNYFKRKGRFKFGLYLEGVFSTQKFFENYTASLLAAPSFEPIPEMKTFFFPQFRAYQYAGGGLNTVINITKNIEARFGAYLFQPVWLIERTADDEARVGEYLDGRSWLASGSFVYHSPLGPVSFNANYYDQKAVMPWSLSLNFGYIIHNGKAIQ